MNNESMVTQADFKAIMDRLEKGPMNLTGKSWRDTPDDPSLAELREHFILPVIEEYVARRTAAQPEREAVLEEAVRQALLQVEKYAEFFCEEDFDPLVDQLRSALTTPAPASVPADGLVEAALREAKRLTEQYGEFFCEDDYDPLISQLDDALAALSANTPALEHPTDATPDKGLREAAKDAVMYLSSGFIECPRCGHEVPTENTDAEYALRDALRSEGTTDG